jgi:toxin CcdB
MAQFNVYRNRNAATQNTTPSLLDVQSNLLSDFTTRVVVPMRLTGGYAGKPMATLMPSFQAEGREVIAITQQIAAISAKEIGDHVADLSDRRFEIIAALDFLISGY